MTNSEKELWLCEFHDAFERGELKEANKMFWLLPFAERIDLCKADYLLRERLVELMIEEGRN